MSHARARKIIVVAAAVAVAAIAIPAGATRPEQMDIKAGNPSGFVPVHDAKSQARKTTSVNMTSHGGIVMPSASVNAIYWGTNWSSASFAGDKMTGLKTWYDGFGNAPYADASDEYSGTNGQVTSSVSHGTDYVDTSAAPKGPPSVSTIVAEVAKVLQANGQLPASDGLGYYPVYVDQPRGGAGYCAWHSYGSINGVNVQVAFFFNLDGDAGCDPQADSTQVSGQSEGLLALANVSAHELSEARTDPRNGGWYDSNGDENGDKCAWAFPAAAYSKVGNLTWIMQGEWSNARYTAGTGYPNRSGQLGCIFSKA
jgi:hypothetical protein